MTLLSWSRGIFKSPLYFVLSGGPWPPLKKSIPKQCRQNSLSKGRHFKTRHKSHVSLKRSCCLSRELIIEWKMFQFAVEDEKGPNLEPVTHVIAGCLSNFKQLLFLSIFLSISYFETSSDHFPLISVASRRQLCWPLMTRLSAFFSTFFVGPPFGSINSKEVVVQLRWKSGCFFRPTPQKCELIEELKGEFLNDWVPLWQ